MSYVEINILQMAVRRCSSVKKFLARENEFTESARRSMMSLRVGVVTSLTCRDALLVCLQTTHPNSLHHPQLPPRDPKQPGSLQWLDQISQLIELEKPATQYMIPYIPFTLNLRFQSVSNALPVSRGLLGGGY